MTAGRTFIGRGREWASCIEAMGTASGVFLVGAAGNGKSRLAAELADHFEGVGRRVVRLHATRSTAELPLGVFAPMLPAEERFLTPMFVEVRNLLTERTMPGTLVLSIDDVDLLDDRSALLVHQLVTGRSVQLIATMRSGSLPANDISDLWRRGALTRIDLGPLDELETRRLSEQMLRGPLIAESAQRIFAATAGNPLFVREIAIAARESGNLESVDGAWYLAELPAASHRIGDLVQARFVSLSAPALNALTHIALGEPLGPGELRTVANLDVLGVLEADELIVATQDARRTVIRLAHPMYGEVLRATTPYLKRRAILATLADDLAATGARRRGDSIRLARLHVDSGQPIDPDRIGGAARTAYTIGDVVLAERLARALFDHAPTFDSGWILAGSLYQQSDLDGSMQHLDAWRKQAPEPGQQAVVAMVEAQVAYWLEHNAHRAHAVLAAGIAALDTGEPGSVAIDAEELVAIGANFHVCSDEPGPALDAARPLLDRGPGPVLIRGSLAAAHALRIAGQGDAAIALLDKAVAAMGVIGPEAISLSSRVLVATRCTCLLELGRLAEAMDLIRHAQADGVDDYALAPTLLVEAMILTMQGSATAAVRVAGTAHRLLVRMHADGAPRWSLAVLALAQARANHPSAAAQTLLELDHDDHPATMFDALIWLARAAERSTAGFPADARALLLDGVTQRRSVDDRAGEGLLLYELARTGAHVTVAPRLAELAAQGQGSMLATRAAHACALVSDDANALIEASRQFAAMPAPLFAAEAAAHAAEAARRSGDQRTANRYSAEAQQLHRLLDTATAATMTHDSGLVPLTRREREIAVLAAQGLPSKDIAERLYISTRTAETHLAKVYDKVGVRSRRELAEALSG